MAGSINFGQFVPGTSFLHRLDPRTKIFCCAGLVLASLLADRPAGFALVSLVLLLALRLGQVGWRLLLSFLRPFALILLLSFVLQAFLTPGEKWLAVGPLALTREGLYLGGTVLWRLLHIAAFGSLLTLTTSPVRLTAGLESILKPLARLGVPVCDVATMITLALRFVPTLLEEAQEIVRAQQCRGAVFGRGGPVTRLRSLVSVLVPLFAGAFRRAEDLATAMEIRCYRGGANRTRMRELRYAARDGAALACTLAVLGAILCWRWWY
ncbi:energy-coupling factor transporter transmembrane component T family protein [Desulfovirgula thermocuniculi]|uniref:energy-coupling factor transporter transmembrane component T family protein n=1 Tax=Desulfovirgula thermocuniculi TaxID=348842 RepID=UPI0003FB3338|nr:energy-coupling factor transporter transmembrane component T [Desulfovirgula thermocuniculi]